MRRASHQRLGHLALEHAMKRRDAHPIGDARELTVGVLDHLRQRHAAVVPVDHVRGRAEAAVQRVVFLQAHRPPLPTRIRHSSASDAANG